MKSATHLYEIISRFSWTTLVNEDGHIVLDIESSELRKVIDDLDHRIRRIAGTKQRLGALEQFSLDIFQEHYDNM